MKIQDKQLKAKLFQDYEQKEKILVQIRIIQDNTDEDTKQFKSKLVQGLKEVLIRIGIIQSKLVGMQGI